MMFVRPFVCLSVLILVFSLNQSSSPSSPSSSLLSSSITHSLFQLYMPDNVTLANSFSAFQQQLKHTPLQQSFPDIIMWHFLTVTNTHSGPSSGTGIARPCALNWLIDWLIDAASIGTTTDDLGWPWIASSILIARYICDGWAWAYIVLFVTSMILLVDMIILVSKQSSIRDMIVLPVYTFLMEF